MENEQKFLKYVVKGDAYVFFYGDEILFYNSRSNPFLYITLENEGVKKELPLYYCDITKISSYGYKIKFYNKNCAVNVKINAIKDTIFFEFTKLGFFGETLSINLFRKNSKIKGMGLNPYKDISGVSLDGKGFLGKNEYCDVKPSFSIKNGYFFKNVDIDDYKLFFSGSLFKINTKENFGQFFLEFGKKYYFGDKEKNIIKFCKEGDLKKIIKSDKEYDGLLLQYNENKSFLSAVKEARKKEYKVYIYFRPTIKKDDEEINKMDNNGLIPYNDEFCIDKRNENNIRVINNRIRRIFDQNVDGLYLDERGIFIESREDEKEPYIGRILHNAIYKISKEYTQKTILYNKLYLDKKNNEVFSVKYEKIKKNEEDYKKSLTYSLEDTVFYECTQKEYEKIKENKTQIIIL